MRRTLFAALTVTIFAAGCDSAERSRVDDVRAKLAGTWLTESETGRMKFRRVVALTADGKFSDRSVVATSGEGSQRQEYAGEWSYDGTNFKRRFLEENGRKYSGGKIRYATFLLVSVSSTELVVDDNIQGGKVVYRRVSEGTQP